MCNVTPLNSFDGNIQKGHSYVTRNGTVLTSAYMIEIFSGFVWAFPESQYYYGCEEGNKLNGQVLQDGEQHPYDIVCEYLN